LAVFDISQFCLWAQTQMFRELCVQLYCIRSFVVLCKPIVIVTIGQRGWRELWEGTFYGCCCSGNGIHKKHVLHLLLILDDSLLQVFVVLTCILWIVFGVSCLHWC